MVLNIKIQSLDNPSLEEASTEGFGEDPHPLDGMALKSSALRDGIPVLLAILVCLPKKESIPLKSIKHPKIEDGDKLRQAIKSADTSNHLKLFGHQSSNDLPKNKAPWESVIEFRGIENRKWAACIRESVIHPDAIVFTVHQNGIDRELTKDEVHSIANIQSDSQHCENDGLHVFANGEDAYAHILRSLKNKTSKISTPILIQYSGNFAISILEHLSKHTRNIELHLVHKSVEDKEQQNRIKFFLDSGINQLKDARGQTSSTINITFYPANLAGPRIIYIPNLLIALGSYRVQPSRVESSPVWGHCDPTTVVYPVHPEFGELEKYVHEVVSELRFASQKARYKVITT